MFDIVGTGMQPPWGKKNIIISKLCLSESVRMQTGFLEEVGLGLGDRKYGSVSIKVIEVYGKTPQFTETN